MSHKQQEFQYSDKYYDEQYEYRYFISIDKGICDTVDMWIFQRILLDTYQEIICCLTLSGEVWASVWVSAGSTTDITSMCIY